MKKELSSKNILQLAWPVMFSQSIVVFVGIIDLFFAGQFGTFAVGAISIANFVCVGIYNFLEGLRSGTTVLVANYFGEKNKLKISKTLNIGLFFALIISILIIFISWIASKSVYEIITNGQISKIGTQYLQTRLYAAPFVLIFFIIAGFFRGLKNTFAPLLIAISIWLINAFLDYIFIYGKFGFSKAGIQGASIATFISYAIGAIISFAAILKNKQTKKYINFRSYFDSFQKSSITEFVKISSDIGLYAGFIVIAFGIFAYMFATISPTSLAAHQLSFQIYMALYLPAMGFLVAASIIIGKLAGANKKDLITFAVLKICGISLAIMVTLGLLFFIFSSQIIYIFSPTDPQVVKIASTSLKIISISLIFGTIFLVLKGALTGVKDTRFLMIIGTITAYAFFLPLSYYLGITNNYGVVGSYIAFLLWTILDCAILSWRFFINKGWEKNE